MANGSHSNGSLFPPACPILGEIKGANSLDKALEVIRGIRIILAIPRETSACGECGEVFRCDAARM